MSSNLNMLGLSFVEVNIQITLVSLTTSEKIQKKVLVVVECS